MNFSIDYDASKLTNKLESDLFEKQEIELFIKREDLVHPVIGGNKFRKLKYNIDYAIQNRHQTIITFGGPYSNHIAATALAGRLHNLQTVGIIRGEELKLKSKWSKTLIEASKNGMQFEFVSRKDYNQKYSEAFIHILYEKFPNALLIPEGGSNFLGINGMMEMVNEISQPFNYVVCPVGTGASINGIAKAAFGKKVIGIDVLKRNEYTVEKMIIDIISNPLYYPPGSKENDSLKFQSGNIKLISQYHFGGYAKTNAVLNTFCENFGRNFNIPVEPVYSGKMFYGILDLITKGYFEKGAKIIAIHTGGLQYL